MSLSAHLHVIGWIMIVLAIVHIAFPKHFDWKKDCNSMSLINRQMMHVHTFFIALTVLLMGLLCVSSASELIHGSLGRKITFGLFIFWVARLLVQFFWYSPLLWRGKRFETTVHILFSVLWTYFSTVFFFAFYTAN